MSGHVKTWLKWIQELSPIAQSVSNVSSGERQAMAEALSFAAPQGPLGMICVDECRCIHGLPTRAAAELITALYDHDAKIREPSVLLNELSDALRADLVSLPSKVVPTNALARWRDIVSTTASNTAAARAQFPRTWAVIVSATHDS